MRDQTQTLRIARSGRIGIALLLGIAICLMAAPLAQAKFAVKQLHLGTISGPQDYLFTAGNTVVEQGNVDRGDYYRFDVFNPSGNVVLSTPCRAASRNGSVGASYILQNSDPVSNSNAWQFELREYTSSSACSTPGSTPRNGASLYFDVASARSYSSSALTTQQNLFGANATAYVQVQGVGEPKTSGTNPPEGPGTWTTSWIAPSGTTACANTTNNANDLPGSTAGGELPDRTSLPSPAQPNLEYQPSTITGPDAWNDQSNYEVGPCPSFATGNQGQWSLKLSAGSTHFVTLPVFSVDTTPPTTTLTSGPSHITASNTATFDFTSSTPGSTFQCSLDGATPSTCTSPATYPGLSSSAHMFTVQAIDPAGNLDPTGATASWTVDTTAPAVTLSAPVAGGYTNDSTPALTGTAESGESAVTVNVYSGNGTSGSPIETQSAAVQSDGSWTISATTLADGTYTVQAQQTDHVNSKTGYSDAHTFTVDTTPPRVTVSTPLNGTHTNDSNPQISGTAGTATPDDSSVTVTISGSGSPLVETASVAPSGQWVVDLPSALADGNYTIQATQNDLAGNTGTGTSHVTIDTTPPQTSLDAAPVGTTSSTTATFSFHGTDALSQAGMTYQCSLDGGAWGLCTSPISYFNLANGTHTFAVEAIDGAGNVDMSGQSTTWTVNTALPAVSLQFPANGSYTNVSTPTFSGDASTATGDSSTVQVLIYRGTDVSGSAVQSLNTTVGSDGSWTATAATLPDGTYAAYAQQVGPAGTANSEAHTFTVDTQAPTTTITVGPPGNSGSGQASFSFSSSAPGASFQCQLDGSSWSACSSPQDYAGLSNGSHTFKVRATNEAGNVGPAASQTWTVNTSLPALSIGSPSDGATTNNPSLTISGTAGVRSGDAATVTVELYSGTSTSGTPVETLSTPVSSGTGAWSTHPSPALQDGTYTVYADQSATAGTAYTAAHTFTVDTTPPTTTIASGPQGTTSATTARFTFNSSEPGSTFQCSLDGGTWTTCTSPQSYTSLTLGTHTFSVEATDAAGNTDPNPPVDSWTIDTAANSPVTITSPTDGTDTSNTMPTFSGAANSKGGDVTVEIDDVNGNPVEYLNQTGSVSSSWSLPTTQALPDGTYTAFASQLGSDGITTDYSSPIELTIDTTPPAVTLTSGPKSLGNDTTPGFSGAAGTASGDLGTVTLKIYSGSSAAGTLVQTIQATASNGSWAATTTTLADGTYTAQASQTDAAGNTGQTRTQTFKIDTVAPNTTITAAPPATTTATSASFGFNSSKTGSTFACKLDGSGWTPCTSPATYTGLSVGQHTFAVRATDPAGNVDPTPATGSWTITAPIGGGSGGSGGSGGTGTSGTGTSGTSTSGTSTSGTSGTGTSGTTGTVKLTLSARARQALSRRGQLKLQVRCAVACSLLLSGKLQIAAKPQPHKRVKPRTIKIRRLLSTKAAAGKRVTLMIKLSAGTRRTIAAALAGKRKVTLTVTGVASARGMKSGTAHVTIRIIR